MGKKTMEELKSEREKLIAEIESLKESKDSVEKGDNTKALEEENTQLRELIESYKKDVENANKFAQQVMLEYGSRSKDNSMEENLTPDKSKEEKEIEEANKALDDYISSKSKGE